MNKTRLVKFLEFSSAIGFGLAYWQFDLQIATITLMVMMTLFVSMAKILKEPLNKLQSGSWLVVIFLGSLTLLLKNEQLIKWKTTVINLLLALIFAGSHVIGPRTIAERLLSSRVKAPASRLRRLNGAAIFYFFLIAGLNLLFAYRFSTTAWVNFRLFGALILNLIFIGGSLYYLRSYLKELPDMPEKK